MNILALETTGDVCSIAVRDSNGTVVERAFRHRMHLSERLIDDVDSVLKDAEIQMPQIDCLAVGIGPGSFTGVRLGVMTMKTWADVLTKPIVGVNAMDALADEHTRYWNGETVTVIRARPGAVYAGAYQSNGLIREPAIVTMEALGDWIAALNSTNLFLVGDGLKRNREAIESACESVAPIFGSTDSPRASVVASIAEKRFQAGLVDNALELAPLYVSPPNIDPRVEARTAEGLRGRTTGMRDDSTCEAAHVS